MTSTGGKEADDERWMGAALALSQRGRGRTAPNPNVGCVVVAGGHVVGRGWTQPGGRPHAEAMALEQAREAAGGSTIYVTLEPCAHQSGRGRACADLLVEARPARVVIAARDPDPRTNGKGIERLRAAGIDVVEGVLTADAESAMAGFFMRQRSNRPYITLKIAISLDGCISMADGTSHWITGDIARAHGHLERARSDLIVIGRGTLESDKPKLDVRLAGLEDRSPRRALLTSGSAAPEGWTIIPSPDSVIELDGVDHVMVEGGPGTSTSFLAADLVDRLMVYRAPVLLGNGKRALGDIGLAELPLAHGRWQHGESLRLGVDTLDVFHRTR